MNGLLTVYPRLTPHRLQIRLNGRVVGLSEKWSGVGQTHLRMPCHLSVCPLHIQLVLDRKVVYSGLAFVAHAGISFLRGKKGVPARRRRATTRE
jgi:hypothetical protein